MEIYGEQTQLALDLVGVFFFAVSGALLAARKAFDIVGSFLLAGLTGLGGGVVRDVLIGEHPPAAFSEPVYLVPVTAAATVVYFFLPHVSRFHRTLLLFDAVGLGLFCVTGTVKALSFDVHPVSAVALGVTTAVGGGLLRDVAAREIPSLFRHDDIYAIPAVLGAIIAAALWESGSLTAATALAASTATFLLRAFALKRGWRAPLAHRRGS
ncbi:MAG TPA: trimeric intracellular cation channel family protein [Jiangellaceae bacterium]|nr:trimeric intracellular cation channel family protein [Jiangellaceae bacterium]